MSNNVGVSTVKQFDPENTEVAARIFFLATLELEKYLAEILSPTVDNQRKYSSWTLGGLNG
jgi:hypothetical protein